MFVALLLVGLYFLPYFIVLGPIANSLIIPDWGAILAAVTFTYGFILYLWAPRKSITPSTLSVYLLLLATTGALIVNTGGTNSAFIALWISVLVFAGVFGLLASVPIVLASSAYVAYIVMNTVNVPSGDITIIVAATLGPLIASYIIFHTKSRKNTQEEAAYNQLASELSQVSNTSEVVIRAINDGVIALDSKGNVALMNPAAQRILGWGSHDALKLNYPSVLKLTDDKNQPVEGKNDPIANTLGTNKEVETANIYAKTGGGKRILLSIVVSPIGQPGEGVIVVFRDITKEHAEEREQAEFISTASHEMRTPVASIEGYLGLALNPNTAQIDAKARDFIEKAHGSAQHLGRLFQDLLDVSKADDGRLSNHPKVVDVISYVGEVVEGLRPRADEKKLRLFYKPQPDGAENSSTDRTLSPVYYANVDNDHLRELVSNLVENAIKYTLKGDVIVDVTGDDLHVTISVQDSGIGIAKEDSAHLFQKFYRIDNTATREIGGTGLGLYLCRRLAEIMNGRIWLESEIDKGSTFYLEIPRTERMEAMRMLEAKASTVAIDSVQVKAEDPTHQMIPEASEFTETSEALVHTPIAPLPQKTLYEEPVAQLPVQPPAALVAPTLLEIENNKFSYTSRPQPSVQIPIRDNSRNDSKL